MPDLVGKRCGTAWLHDLFTFTLVPSLLFLLVVACSGAKEAQGDRTRHQRHPPLWSRGKDVPPRSHLAGTALL